MQNFLNFNTNTTTDFMKDFLDDKAKYEKNKKEFDYYLDKYSFKASNDKEFYKQIFKIMDNILNDMEEEVFNTLGIYVDIPVFTKIILFLKYKETNNYKDKIKIIKQICGDITFEEIILHENFIFQEINFLCDSATDKVNNILTQDMGPNVDKDMFRKHLLLLKNIILITKCVLFNYHKKELKYVENGVPKFKITGIKTIYSFTTEFKLGYKIDPSDLIKLLKMYEAGSDKKIYTINIEIATLMLYAYLNEGITNDEYNKFLLDKDYNDKISNRLKDFSDIHTMLVHSDVFKRRKILIPKNGIIILVENEESPIESILLSEKKLLGFNNLYFITRYKNGTEVINSVILANKLPYNSSIIGSNLECDTRFYYTLAYVFSFLDIGEFKEEVYIKYSVISPSYWKYRNKGYISSNDKLNDKGVVIKREFDIEIAPFIRKISGEPGKEAKDLANELGIILEKGYTIVKPHTRTYNKINR